MSIITTYPNIGGLANDDLMIISDVSKVDNPTRTVSLSQLAGFIGTGGGGGGSTTVEATTPLVAETEGSTVTLSMLPASSTQDGYLTSTVFNTLSGKQDALIVTKNGTSGEATFDGTTLNIPNYTNSGGGGTTVVANPGSPTANLTSIEIDSTSYALPTYNANEVAFWISRDTNSNNITIRSIKSAGSDGTTFSIAEEGTLTGVFIITASTNYWATDTFWVTMSINCPVSYLVDTKLIVKRAHINRISGSQLQVEFFQETSSSTETLERVDLVLADTTAPNAAQGIDIRVKRYMFPQ